jgi:hypothetical protein
VQTLLEFRHINNTVLFPPSSSASGQALDAALGMAGLLLEHGLLQPGLSNALVSAAGQARLAAGPAPAEELLLDLLSLGQRLNAGQLKHFVARIEDARTLRLLAHLAREDEARLPVLFAAVDLTGSPAAVARYIMALPQTGFTDLGAALAYGAGGLAEVLNRQQRLYNPPGVGPAPVGPLIEFAWHDPPGALALKWLLYLAGGFALAMAAHFARPAVPPAERPLQVPGLHYAREALFGLGLLVAVLLVSEPFLADNSQRAPDPWRPRLTLAGGAVASSTPAVKTTLMNQLSLLTLGLFFVLQALLYVASLVKLAEIRRQRVPARLQLRLLENEEHLFDAGLYLGFAGTIVSLILVSMGVIKPSLMAAYSSTSFGIVFVSIFKIFHLRPLRRHLLLESEAPPPELVPAETTAAFATSP